MPHKSRAAGEADKVIGSKIRGMRLRAGMSQVTLGERLKVTFQQIQKYESGTNRISGARLQHIAYIFHCDVGDLLPPQGGGKKRGVVPSSLDKVAATQDGRKLIDYFATIKNPEHRAAVVSLARRLKPNKSDGKKTTG